MPKREITVLKHSLEEVKKFGKGYSVVPVSLEIFSDICTPMQVLQTLQEKFEKSYVLESVEGGNAGAKWGRYTFLGYNPSLTVYGTDNKITLNGKTFEASPTEVLNNIIGEYKSPVIEGLPAFTGGLVGYFSYEYVKYAELSLNFKGANPENFNDFYFMLFDKVIAFDHFKQKIVLIANIKTDDIEKNYSIATAELLIMREMVIGSIYKAKNLVKTDKPPQFERVFSKQRYCEMVTQTKKYIAEGEIFQAVLSNRQIANFSGSLLNVYRNLRTLNPSPYMFFLNFGDIQIAGASPETLISVKNKIASTYPLAGTTRRGKTKQEDDALVEALLSNEKELSEHNQLVDLGRNDVGKISEFGTVKVEEYLTIRQLSHVSHIASKVTGVVKDGVTPLDIVNAVMPAGTLSGAPKKRACEIIDELEKLKRGPYGGAAGYIDFTGNMDLCIGIRMAVAKDGKAYVQSGAGVVYDSIPENEFLECERKIAAMIEAFAVAEER
jgi:anthranilate synthase component 1